MSRPLNELVKFRGDKLFNGAVNVDWFQSDAERSRSASKAFVFHGPQYHGVSQADIGTAHGYRLQDTASFAQSIVRRCYGQEEEPFTLAIAGYGTGKSHLGLTIASLLNDPTSELASSIIEGIGVADASIAQEIVAILRESNQPCLVVALNGMQNYDLSSQITKQILFQLKARDLDTRPLDELRPRFAHASSLVNMANADVITELLAGEEASSKAGLLEALDRQDEAVYKRVYDVFSQRGMVITALRGESARDVIDTTVQQYCGDGKPFHSLLILFDEFGRYTEFATVKSQIAGSGALQDLFEGVQANSRSACFVGFIQFELSAYVQRIAPEYRNEILRYVTRYQTANRSYLSINMETLIAHLIQKQHPEELDAWFDESSEKSRSVDQMHELARWFPQTSNHRLWQDIDQFHTVVRKGCWPLSAYSTWFLFHLAAAGKHLQERSALALLGNLFERYRDWPVTQNSEQTLAPADLWSNDLQQELITSEEGGQQGSITHAYTAVMSRQGVNLDDSLQRLLRAVVIAAKLGLKVRDKSDAAAALSHLAGVSSQDAISGLQLLQEEYNVIEWDQAFRQYDILGDAVPRTQFLSFIRQRVASAYDDVAKAKLFASKASQWCELLTDLDCDFAEENRVTTREWRYLAKTSDLENLPMHLKFETDRWNRATSVDEPRGSIIYCYVAAGEDSTSVESKVKKQLREAAAAIAAPATPVFVVLLDDEEGALGQALAEYAVLSESISAEDRSKYGNLIPAHLEKLTSLIRSHIDTMIKQRRYITMLKEDVAASRLSRVATEIFSKIYRSIIPFPFDGFSTSRGNAAVTCHELTRELMLGKLDYETVLGKPVKEKNRALTVLHDSWGVFGQNGRVLTRAKQSDIKRLSVQWDEKLATGDRRLSLSEIFNQLCKAPYGANSASAGLLLGVFLAPRLEKLVVDVNGQRHAVSQWMLSNLFRGKFVDASALQDAELVSTGEESSEWTALLDEWEQATTYAERVGCLMRCAPLKKRMPPPPSEAHRVLHLESLARDAVITLNAMREKQENAMQKLESGYERNLRLAIWGAADLKEIADQMRSKLEFWGPQAADGLDPHVERARQHVIQEFPDWLSRQSPANESPDVVGKFKHEMLHQTGANLKKLALDDQVALLEQHVRDRLRNIETTVECQQLLRDVNSWISLHGNVPTVVRVAECRNLLNVAREHLNKLQGMNRRISMPEIGEARIRLAAVADVIKRGQEDVEKRAGNLWDIELKSLGDLETAADEVDALLVAFDGCDNDLDDLRAMRRALRLYRECYERLSDIGLTWSEFEQLSRTQVEAVSQAISEGEVPWDVQETLEAFARLITQQRTRASQEWMEDFVASVNGIHEMSAVEANRLYERAIKPPAVLSPADNKALLEVTGSIETRLDALKLDWLVEKFKELSGTLRERFLQLVQEPA